MTESLDYIIIKPYVKHRREVSDLWKEIMWVHSHQDPVESIEIISDLFHKYSNLRKKLDEDVKFLPRRLRGLIYSERTKI